MSTYKKRAIPNAIRREVCRRYGAEVGRTVEVMCATCGNHGLIEWPERYAYWPIIHHLHLDHVIPERHGGAMAADNFQLLCPSCNKRKKDKLPERRTADAHPINQA